MLHGCEVFKMTMARGQGYQVAGWKSFPATPTLPSPHSNSLLPCVFVCISTNHPSHPVGYVIVRDTSQSIGRASTVPLDATKVVLGLVHTMHSASTSPNLPNTMGLELNWKRTIVSSTWIVITANGQISPYYLAISITSKQSLIYLMLPRSNPMPTHPLLDPCHVVMQLISPIKGNCRSTGTSWPTVTWNSSRSSLNRRVIFILRHLISSCDYAKQQQKLDASANPSCTTISSRPLTVFNKKH
mmetsp:Transcript_15823/g.26456  ORF Transcript_15823/g.26456 Transcript_15823/m.26456 type:complete len:243 (+) Transcript_15823:367-1095(+)